MACRPGALGIKLEDRNELLVLWLVAAGGVLALFWLPIANRNFEWGFDFFGYGLATAFAVLFAAALLFVLALIRHAR